MFMEGRWAMVKCECGRYFGSSSKNVGGCPRCGSDKNLKIMKKYSSSKSLRDDISKANTPSEIENEISVKFEKYDSKIRKRDTVSADIIQKIIKTSTTDEKIITIDSISNSISKLALSKITAEDIIEILEASSLVLRNSNGSWTVLQ